jgi:branched-chain amino acid transport system ATP-binding protein
LPLLQVTDIQAGYDRLQVLWDVSLTVSEGEFVALIGPNGAGKTSTLRAIIGLIKPKSGSVVFRGKSIAGMRADQVTRLGMSLVTEDSDLFPAMSVEDNLILGAYTRRDRKAVKVTLAYVYDLFPVLAERKKQLAGTLSGGERKMLAVGRGLMLEPQIILVDEPSLGLAPKLVLSVFEALRELHHKGVTVLLVEQNVNTTLHTTDRAYVLEHGRIVLEGASQELLKNAYLQQTYIGAQELPG